MPVGLFSPTQQFWAAVSLIRVIVNLATNAVQVQFADAGKAFADISDAASQASDVAAKLAGDARKIWADCQRRHSGRETIVAASRPLFFLRPGC